MPEFSSSYIQHEPALTEFKVSVLLVDDQLIIAEAIRRMLSDQQDIEFHYVTDASQALDTAQRLQPTVILQDLVLPGIDGFSLIKLYREQEALAHVPVIVLSAKDDPKLKAHSFAVGANDYVVKLPDRLELLARIRSVLRRSHAMPSNVPSDKAQQIRFSGWTLDLTARHLLNPSGLVIMLSGAEFRLLRVFLEHPNRVLNRDQLLNLTQGRDADPFDRSIDIQISRLRQKLGEDARLPQIIKTVRNGGYVLAGQVNVEPHA
ncbi:MAG: response regulator transcription factor [Janthinobacterium sp.]